MKLMKEPNLLLTSWVEYKFKRKKSFFIEWQRRRKKHKQVFNLSFFSQLQLDPTQFMNKIRPILVKLVCLTNKWRKLFNEDAYKIFPLLFILSTSFHLRKLVCAIYILRCSSNQKVTHGKGFRKWKHLS